MLSIVSNGNINSMTWLKGELEKSNYIIAVDGGISYLRKLDKKPNLLIGDLDSIDAKDLKWAKENSINLCKYPSEKDKTDTEIALEKAKTIITENEAIHLYGATGSRLDHTMGNIFLLEKYLSEFNDILICDEKNKVFLIKDSIKTIIEENDINLSLIPLSDYIIVDLEGFKYPLKDKKILRGDTLGISNLSVEKKSNIIIKKGKALVFLSKD